MSEKRYGADEITVLKDLEPVQLRPGMYTDTTRPNHLGQEVIDNSVDEALSGFADKIDVILHADNSLEVVITGGECRSIFIPPRKFQGWSLS
ncbi:DNA topoisomerase 4 subunit B [Mannheimia haemolytica]